MKEVVVCFSHGQGSTCTVGYAPAHSVPLQAPVTSTYLLAH